MKKAVSTFALLAVLVGGLQAADDASTDQAKLAESAKKWELAKKLCNGNYSYKVRWSSFVGFGHETRIVVRDNKVSERHFKTLGESELVVPGQPQPNGDMWSEKGDELGSHKKGASAKTLDELYTEAQEVVKKTLQAHERRYVRFDKHGLLLACFIVDTRIADDAPTKGVNISSITLGETGATKDKLGNGGKVFKAPNGKPFPAHWGEPPQYQTRDIRPLPGGYGQGSSTLARWIQMNLDRDAKKE